jgi:hypothetical protein
VGGHVSDDRRTAGVTTSQISGTGIVMSDDVYSVAGSC